MSVNINPKIVRSNLVYHYDMFNTKNSWIGRPTTNSFLAPTPDISGNVVFPVQGTGTFQRIFSGIYGGYTIKPTDVVYKYVLGVNGCHYHGYDTAILSGQKAVWSCDYYIDSSVRDYPTANYLANLEGVTSGAAGDYTPYAFGTWRSFTFTATASADGNCRALLYPGSCGNTYLASAGFILYKNPQMEIGTSTNASPYVNGTRSASQSLLDLTKKNTTTINSLTYNADGTFKFDGALSNSISIPDSTNTRFSHNSPWSIQLAVNITGMVNSFPGILKKGSAASSGVILFYSNLNNGTLYWKHNNTNFIITTITYGTPFILTITYDGISSMIFYKNGVQIASSGAMIATDTSNSLNLGTADDYGSSYIYQFLKYSVALTATQVLNNFEAIRSRHGL